MRASAASAHAQDELNGSCCWMIFSSFLLSILGLWRE